MLDRASICSVTRIVPSSAAIALPTRPASIVAASTGPNSRTSDMLITAPSRVSRPSIAELGIALHRQYHANERAGQRDHRQAEHPHLIEIRQDRAPSRPTSEQPRQRAPTKNSQVADHRNTVDDRGSPIRNPVVNRVRQRLATPTIRRFRDSCHGVS